MHNENVPMHIEGDWHQHFYQKVINLTQGSHTQKQHGGTRFSGIRGVYSQHLILEESFGGFDHNTKPTSKSRGVTRSYMHVHCTGNIDLNPYPIPTPTDAPVF